MSHSKTLKAFSPLIIASIVLMGCEAAQTAEPAASDQVMTNEVAVEVEEKEPHDIEVVLIMLVVVGIIVAFPSLQTKNCGACLLIGP